MARHGTARVGRRLPRARRHARWRRSTNLRYQSYIGSDVCAHVGEWPPPRRAVLIWAGARPPADTRTTMAAAATGRRGDDPTTGIESVRGRGKGDADGSTVWLETAGSSRTLSAGPGTVRWWPGGPVRGRPGIEAGRHRPGAGGRQDRDDPNLAAGAQRQRGGGFSLTTPPCSPGSRSTTKLAHAAPHEMMHVTTERDREIPRSSRGRTARVDRTAASKADLIVAPHPNNAQSYYYTLRGILWKLELSRIYIIFCADLYLPNISTLN